MVSRNRMSFEGPFVRLGNTFFDNNELLFQSPPNGPLTPMQYSEVSRLFLHNRRLGNFNIFDELPHYLQKHQNGILWRDMMLLSSFTMPHAFIGQMHQFFISDMQEEKNQFVIYHIFKMLLESGILEFVDASLDIFELLEPDTNFHEISCLYAMIIEEGIGYDKSKSEIICFQREQPSDFISFLRMKMSKLTNRHGKNSPLKIHCGKACRVDEVLLSLAECLKHPSYYERIYYEKVLLEAYSGFDLRDFYSKLSLQPISAFSALERLSNEVDLTSFKPGYRYFFSQKIPD